jgi:hypothetical protein
MLDVSVEMGETKIVSEQVVQLCIPCEGRPGFFNQRTMSEMGMGFLNNTTTHPTLEAGLPLSCCAAHRADFVGWWGLNGKAWARAAVCLHWWLASCGAGSGFRSALDDF